MTAFRITQYDTEAIISWNGRPMGILTPAGDSDAYNFRILVAAIASGLQAGLIHQFTATHGNRNSKRGRPRRGKTKPQQPNADPDGHTSGRSGRHRGRSRPGAGT